MDFCKALTALKEGKKVRHIQMSNGVHIRFEKNYVSPHYPEGTFPNGVLLFESPVLSERWIPLELHSYYLLSDEWEIVSDEEIKKFRDYWNRKGLQKLSQMMESKQ